MKYIQENPPDDECIFCQAAASKEDEKHLVFYRGEHVFMILNRYPYTSGHVMCVPYVHEARLQALNRSIRTEMMELVNRAVEVVGTIYHPDGFNIGMNLGKVAGAGIADHLHTHIVPRWGGDTNFMTSVGATRVLPESLSDTYQRVKAAWHQYPLES